MLKPSEPYSDSSTRPRPAGAGLTLPGQALPDGSTPSSSAKMPSRAAPEKGGLFANLCRAFKSAVGLDKHGSASPGASAAYRDSADGSLEGATGSVSASYAMTTQHLAIQRAMMAKNQETNSQRLAGSPSHPIVDVATNSSSSSTARPAMSSESAALMSDNNAAEDTDDQTGLRPGVSPRASAYVASSADAPRTGSGRFRKVKVRRKAAPANEPLGLVKASEDMDVSHWFSSNFAQDRCCEGDRDGDRETPPERRSPATASPTKKVKKMRRSRRSQDPAGDCFADLGESLWRKPFPDQQLIFNGDGPNKPKSLEQTLSTHATLSPHSDALEVPSPAAKATKPADGSRAST